jgi:hypothetical protein
VSYESESFLPRSVRLQDVREFVELLGYKKTGITHSKQYGRFEEYFYFDDQDYRSWIGVLLAIQVKAKSLVVSMRTTVARSFYDLDHQNRTIFQLRKRFGGHFRTDEGKGRYMRPESGPPTPAASGCHIAFERFGHNLILGKMYLDARTFPKQYQGKADEFLAEMGMSPRLLSNNMLLPFIVAALEDYFKSTFVALLKYSPRKQTFFKGLRLQGDHLAAISDGKSVESQVAETLPFQRISSIVRHFESLDPKVDLAGFLKKPYRRRKQSLYDLIEMLVTARHNFIHRAQLDSSLTDKKMDDLIYDLDEAISRVYKGVTNHYNWHFDRGWHLGNRRAAKRYLAHKAQQGAAGDAPNAARP